MEVKAGYKQTEVGVIPEEWDVFPLEEIADPKRPICYGIVQTGRPVSNGIRCVRVVDIVGGRVNTTNLITTSPEISRAYKRTILSQRDLIIALRGKIGELALIDDELVGANLTRGVALLAPKDGYDSNYLCQALSSPRGKLVFERNLNGSALQEIPIATLRKIPAAIPPLTEQRAITAALGDVDGLIEGLDRLIAKKRDLKQAATQQLLTGQTRLPGFSGEWESRTFGEMFDVLRNASNSRSDLTDHGEMGYLHYGDIHTHRSVFLDCGRELQTFIMPAKVANAARMADGDLVMVDASEDTVAIGKAVEIKALNGRKAVAGLHTLLLRPRTGFFADGFKGYLQCVPSVRSALVRLATGVSVYGISKSCVKTIEVSIPKPPEQAAIAAVLSDMDAEIAALEARRGMTRMLKQRMMQELLTGRTRLA